MSEQPVSSDAVGAVRQRPRWARWLIGAAAVLLGILLIVWNIFPAPTINTPLTLVRNVRGEFESDQEVQGATLQVQAGRIKAKNSLTSANSTSHSNEARSCYRQVLLVCKSHDALSQRVAADLLKELQKVPHFAEIKYVPPGHALPTSGRAPDLFIQLELLSLSESGLIDHQVDARFRARWGGTLAQSRHSYINHLTPPLIQSHSTAELQHHSTTREVASSAAKYKLVAADIAKQFGGTIAKDIDAQVQKSGVLPNLPDEFYVAYTVAPQLPLDGFASELVFSGRGLLKHNETAWQCRGEAPLGESLLQLRERLVEAGYKSEKPTEPTTYIRATKGASVVEAFVDHPGVFGQLPDAERSQPDHDFIVTFTEWASLEERAAAIDRLLDDKADFNTLMIFAHSFNQKQNERLLERVADEPPHTAQDWQWAGRIYERNQDREGARDALANAVLLLPLSKDQMQVETSLKSLAKDLGDEMLLETLKNQPPDFERVKKLGFVEISLGGEPAILEFDAGGAARLFMRGSDKSWNLATCSVVQVGSGASKQNELHLAQVTPHGSSQVWGQNVSAQHGAKHSMGLGGLRRLELSITQLKGQPRFELTAKLSAATPKNNATAQNVAPEQPAPDGVQ